LRLGVLAGNLSGLISVGEICRDRRQDRRFNIIIIRDFLYFHKSFLLRASSQIMTREGAKALRNIFLGVG
jgi:hypothetical protein